MNAVVRRKRSHLELCGTGDVDPAHSGAAQAH